MHFSVQLSPISERAFYTPPQVSHVCPSCNSNIYMKLSIVQTDEYRNYPRRTCVSAALPTTNLTRSGLRSNPHLRRTRPATNHLSQGTVIEEEGIAIKDSVRTAQ